VQAIKEKRPEGGLSRSKAAYPPCTAGSPFHD